MVNPKKAAKLIRQHFSELTAENFVENLRRSCPEIFEDNELLAESENLASQPLVAEKHSQISEPKSLSRDSHRR
ncbi:MAG: hypothetical protein QNJ55_25135 [Xenococcus sp. MO_188.B8]|nr:hypothetical protein [Xenococcus sp. MO_188.B8]